MSALEKQAVPAHFVTKWISSAVIGRANKQLEEQPVWANFWHQKGNISASVLIFADWETLQLEPMRSKGEKRRQMLSFPVTHYLPSVPSLLSRGNVLNPKDAAYSLALEEQQECLTVEQNKMVQSFLDF